MFGAHASSGVFLAFPSVAPEDVAIRSLHSLVVRVLERRRELSSPWRAIDAQTVAAELETFARD
eukprot:6646371-Prymnesium_polylepis.1